MLATKYFVLWFIHNKETGKFEGMIVDQYDSYSAAKKEYHRQLSMYIDDPQFDSVAVDLMDSCGNKLDNEYWSEPGEEPSV